MPVRFLVGLIPHNLSDIDCYENSLGAVSVAIVLSLRVLRISSVYLGSARFPCRWVVFLGAMLVVEIIARLGARYTV